MKKKKAVVDTGFVKEIKSMIETARGRAAAAVNAEMTMLYWNIGARIRKEILKGKRAEYGKEILPTLSAKLTADYGKGFDDKNLWRMVQFNEYFKDRRIVVTLSRQLS